jgi:hypothetical protein
MCENHAAIRFKLFQREDCKMPTGYLAFAMSFAIQGVKPINSRVKPLVSGLLELEIIVACVMHEVTHETNNLSLFSGDLAARAIGRKVSGSIG